MQNLSASAQVNLRGDGRADSPGHNAKYGLYTMMDEGTSKVATFNLVQVTEVTSSNAMEKEGFQRCVKYLQDNNIKINRIATDRHTSIAKEMRKNQKKIKHQYDTWHMSKWVVKQLNKKAKKRSVRS